MTIFSLQRDEIFSRLSESKPPSHTQNTKHKHKTHNTSYVVQLFSLSFSLLLVFLLQFRFATTPEEEAEAQQQQQKISKSLESNIFYFQALGKRKRERERERFFLFSSFFFFSVFGLAKDFLLLLDKTSSSSEVSLSFSLLHCLCFFLLKCIFHSSCLRLLFCSLLFCGFVRLNFTVWLLIRSFWGLDLT